TLCHRRGEYPRALRTYRTAMRRLEAEGPESVELGRLALEYAAVRHRQGQHAAARTWAQRAADLAEATGDLHTSALAENLLQVATTHGAGGPGDEHGRRALSLFRELGDVQNEGKALNNLGVEAHFRNDWATAGEHYRLAAAAFERSGDVVEA